MFLGALAAWLWAKLDARSAERCTIPASSGLIAGESLMGVAILLWLQGPGMFREIWRYLQGF